MEIPIQVAVQIYTGYRDEPCCVQTIPANSSKSHKGANHVSVNAPIKTGLVQVNGHQHSYSATHALPFGCTQESIFNETVLPLIDMFMKGYDISVVMYGQHGCGKTYTLLGQGIDCIYSATEYGIIQRITREVFRRLKVDHPERSVIIHFGWVEICGDEIHDILGCGNVPCAEISEVFERLKLGSNRRSQEASHSLITLTLEQQWISPEGLIQHRLSTASFCDLCGTERMFMMNSMDQQISVPKDRGLQTLEQIVTVLSDVTSSVTHSINMNLLNLYTQQMLTRLLKDSFGGRAQTLVILCVSPLEQDIPETISNLEFVQKVQRIRNLVIMNTFSDNNMPLTNFIYQPRPQVEPVRIIGDSGEVEAGLPVQDSFGLKFAASQWLKLVSNAEGLFSKLLVNNKTLNDQDRERIEEWLFLKQECEDCLSSSDAGPLNPRLLGTIQEAEEHDDTTTSGAASPISDPHTLYVSQKKMAVRNSMATDNDSDFEDALIQYEYLEEKIGDLMEAFTLKTNELVNDKFNEFINTKKERDGHDSADADEEYNNNIEKDGIDVAHLQQRRASASGLSHSSGGLGGRRRSIQPSDPSIGACGSKLSDADLAHLQRVAEDSEKERLASSLENSAYIDAEKFLQSSNEMHPLRMAQVNKEVDEWKKKHRKITIDLSATKDQIRELEKIVEANQKLMSDVKQNSGPRKKAKINYNEMKNKLMAQKAAYEKQLKHSSSKSDQADIRKKLAEKNRLLSFLEETTKYTTGNPNRIIKLEEDIRNSKKKLKALQKNLNNLQKDKEKCESMINKAKDVKSDKTGAGASNTDSRITHIDDVLNEKIQNLRITDNEKEQSLRHEIRNLRSERERLLRDRCTLDERLRMRKYKSEEDARDIVECDVVIEVIDSAIEFKNELICGQQNKTVRGESISRNAIGLAVDQVGRYKLGGKQLRAQLNKLSEEEMRTLLYKCLQKIIDLRSAGCQLEEQVSHCNVPCAASFKLIVKCHAHFGTIFLGGSFKQHVRTIGIGSTQFTK